MPDLRSQLEAAAEPLRPDATPPFAAIQARARRRRRRHLATAAMGSALTVTLLAVGATALVDRSTVTTPGPVATGPAATADQSWPPGAVEEPRPFTVPTTDPSGEVIPTYIGEIATGGISVPWTLTRIWANETRFGVNHERSCSESGGGDVRVQETDEWVLVQALSAASADYCDAAPARAVIQLKEPLGDRPLLHARTGHLGDPADERTLAQRYTSGPAWPGEPWYRDGRPVDRNELALFHGAEHCNWHTATALSGSAIARQGTPGSLYWRDPSGALEHEPTLQRDFQSRAELPADAAATGYTQRGVELWTATSDIGRYVYLVRTADRSDVERWVAGFGGCA